MNPPRDFIKARDLLAKGYCKNHMAMTDEGVVVDPQDPKASRFCVWGAIERASGGPNKDITKAVDALYKHVPESFKVSPKVLASDYGHIAALVDYNNAPETTQADMVALFDKALAA